MNSTHTDFNILHSTGLQSVNAPFIILPSTMTTYQNFPILVNTKKILINITVL